MSVVDKFVYPVPLLRSFKQSFNSKSHCFLALINVHVFHATLSLSTASVSAVDRMGFAPRSSLILRATWWESRAGFCQFYVSDNVFFVFVMTVVWLKDPMMV